MMIQRVERNALCAILAWSLGLGGLLGGGSPAGAQRWETHLYANDLRGVAAGPEGRIYAASAGGALVYDPGTGTFEQWNRTASGLLSDSLSALLVAPSGEIWFGTETQGISIYHPDLEI
ncbi:MAG: hypothetical protein GF355_13735, partial [Candidatus Eisenbacteria bacterium]|nr:hypothetical protein [Candidatus Eisenbacteria bacterium]